MTTRHRKRAIREARLTTGLLEQRKTTLRASIGRLREAGRVLSAANEEKIQSALDALSAVLASLEKPDAPATEVGEAAAKCETCKGEGTIREGNMKCPDCGGSGEGTAQAKEARHSRLMTLAEAYSSAASDAADGSYIIASLLNLMSGESDEPGEIAVLQSAFSALTAWVQMEVSTIGSPDDLADSEDEADSMWVWESALTKLAAAGGPPPPPPPPAPTPDAGGYVPEPYKADPDETVQCPMCGLMNSPDAKFCDQCGVALTSFHPSIGESKLRGALIAIREASVSSEGLADIKVIQPGWGATGYYPSEVLQRDGESAFPAGTKMFWDHPTVSEEWERPERSLRDLAAETTTPATWQENGADGPGLYAKAKVFENFAPTINELAPSIGVSIRAMGKASYGEAEGQQGLVIEEITQGESIDFVTFPGAGGAVLSLFEAARQRPDHIKPQEANMTESDPKFVAEKQRADRAEEAVVVMLAERVIATKLAEAKIPDVTRIRLQAALTQTPPIKDGKLDSSALEAKIDEAVKAEIEYAAALTGAGKVKGMGNSAQVSDDLTPQLEGAFKKMGMTEAAAKVAATGRSK